MRGDTIKQLQKYEEEINKYCEVGDKECRKKVIDRLFENKMRRLNQFTKEVRKRYFYNSYYIKPSEQRKIAERRKKRKLRRQRIRQMKKDGTFNKWVSKIRKGFK